MKQPEALRLADVLERSVNNPHRYWQGEAATELRRLHEVNAELLEALKSAVLFSCKAHAHWDADRDMKVGKHLLALAGMNPGYDKQIDELHATITKAGGAS